MPVSFTPSAMSTRFTRLIPAALLGLAALPATAQTTYGPRVGLNLSSVSYDVKTGDAPTIKMLAGAQVGVFLNVRFGKLALQPAVLFSQKGYKASSTSREVYSDTLQSKGTFIRDSIATTPVSATVRLNYLEIPVNLVYTFGETRGFQVIAGPYVGFGFSGKEKTDATTTRTVQTEREIESQPQVVDEFSTAVAKQEADVKFQNDVKATDDFTKAYYRPLDVGLNLGLGYRRDRFQLQAFYGLGMSNILPKEAGKTPNGTAKNRVIQFSVSYLFGADATAAKD